MLAHGGGRRVPSPAKGCAGLSVGAMSRTRRRPMLVKFKSSNKQAAMVRRHLGNQDDGWLAGWLAPPIRSPTTKISRRNSENAEYHPLAKNPEEKVVGVSVLRRPRSSPLLPQPTTRFRDKVVNRASGLPMSYCTRTHIQPPACVGQLSTGPTVSRKAWPHRRGRGAAMEGEK